MAGIKGLKMPKMPGSMKGMSKSAYGTPKRRKSTAKYRPVNRRPAAKKTAKKKMSNTDMLKSSYVTVKKAYQKRKVRKIMEKEGYHKVGDSYSKHAPMKKDGLFKRLGDRFHRNKATTERKQL